MLYHPLTPLLLAFQLVAASFERRAEYPSYGTFDGMQRQQAQGAGVDANQHPSPPPFTTENGAPSRNHFEVQRAGHDGPLLMQSTQMIDTLAHFVRERIPERIVHARGWGAIGTLEITTDFAEKYSMAEVFKKGTKTWSLCRFSTVGGQSGSPDVARDPR